MNATFLLGRALLIRADSTFIVTTLSELKIAFRSLLYKVHPDRGFSGSFRGWWWVSHRLDWDSVFFRRLCVFGPFSIPFSGLGSAPFGASLYVGVGVEHRCSEVASYQYVFHSSNRHVFFCKTSWIIISTWFHSSHPLIVNGNLISGISSSLRCLESLE